MATQDHVEHSHHQEEIFGEIRSAAPVFADIGTSVYYTGGILWGIVKTFAGFFVGLTTIPFLLLCIMYQEVTYRYKRGGGVTTTAKESMGTMMAALGGICISIDYVLTVSISSLSGVLYLAVVSPQIAPYAIWITIGILILLGILNWIGINESVNVATVGATIAFISQFAILVTVFCNMSFIDIVALIPAMFHGESLTWQKILIGYGGAFLAFSGLESISQLSPTMKNRRQTSKRAMIIVFFAVFITSWPLTVLSTMLQPVYADDPVKNGQLISLLAGHFHGWWGSFLQVESAISAAGLLIFACITGIIGGYCVQISLARLHVMPEFLLKRNKTRHTPHNAIAIMVGIPIVLLVIIGLFVGVEKALDFLGSMYAYGLLGAFTITCLGISLVRQRERKFARIAGDDLFFEKMVREKTSLHPEDKIPYTKKEVTSLSYSLKFWLGWLTLFMVAVAWLINLWAKPLALIVGGSITVLGLLLAHWCYKKHQYSILQTSSQHLQQSVETIEEEKISRSNIIASLRFEQFALPAPASVVNPPIAQWATATSTVLKVVEIKSELEELPVLVLTEQKHRSQMTIGELATYSQKRAKSLLLMEFRSLLMDRYPDLVEEILPQVENLLQSESHRIEHLPKEMLKALMLQHFSTSTAIVLLVQQQIAKVRDPKYAKRF